MCKKIKLLTIKLSIIFCGIVMSLILLPFVGWSQDIKIEIGKKEVALNEPFTISIIVENDRIKNYDEFPDIQGFTKQAKSTSSSTNIINGKISSSQRIVQNYLPNMEGTYTLSPFEMTINGKIIYSQGAQIRVNPESKGSQRSDPFALDPFEEFFGTNEPQEYIDVKADVFFALTTDKPEVYVGEGFIATLAYYEAETNRAQLQFYELNEQINNILKKIKPVNCWEENFEIENITGVPVTINGKRYKQYKLYQAALYPLNNESIVFPKIELNMIKYKVAKNPTFFGQNRKGDIIQLTSQEKTVKVKELPPHPLKDKVAVGEYHLKEAINSRDLVTGTSFNYQFTIIGEGNISAINNPTANGKGIFDFYPPNVRQDITRASNHVTGSKSFVYYGIPKEPGKYNLGEFIEWVFFNPRKQQYETLRSRFNVDVSGESKKNQTIASSDMGSFYDIIELEDNVLTSRVPYGQMKIFANIIIFLMLALTFFILIRK